METKELIQLVRRIEIKTKGLVNEVFSGEYHSAFKGRGMEFAEVREYQPGDDIRSIDWNVTARFGHPFIKIFEEERELTIMLIVDVSGSLAFGSTEKSKQRISAEISSILAFSAMKNNDKVGLILFSDRIEKFVPPKKGRSHVLRIIREILSYKPEGNKTDIKLALEYFNSTIKKRSISFLISDFLAKDYEKIIKIVARKHDLVGIILEDIREKDLPKIGLVKFLDLETNQTRFIDLSNEFVQKFIFDKNLKRENEINRIFKLGGIDSIKIQTNESYIPPLVKFFKKREAQI
jgi:uncharacterized protein (DUF58 family)